jgi:arylsulfatase A-like enzyme
MSPQMSRRSFLKSVAPLLLAPLFSGQARAVGVPQGWRQQDQAAPNVLILVFDALSAKHVSVYGYRRETTPNLARFAERATVYHAHYAGGNFTPPGTASLLTGTYPWANRAFNHSGTVAEDYERRNLFQAFGATWHRIAYTHNLWANSLLVQFRQDIDVYVHPREFCLFDGQIYGRLFQKDANIAYQSFEGFLTPSVQQRPGSLLLSLADEAWVSARRRTLNEEVANLYPRGVPGLWKQFFLLERAMDGIEALISNSRKPFLGYFHLLPPHGPYNTRREFVDRFADGWIPGAKEPHFFAEGHTEEYLNHQRRQYDEYIAYADAEFGRLYDFMVQAGLLDNTYVVVTSDHGEMFERGILAHQTQTLYDPIIHIPLLISRPGQRDREDVHTATSCVDVLPTLLEATGQAIPDWCEGLLLPGLGGRDHRGERGIFAVEAKGNPKQAPLSKGTAALIKGQYKLIHYFGYSGYEDRYELYDLANDPEEMEDLISSSKSVAADLQSELRGKLDQVNQRTVG